MRKRPTVADLRALKGRKQLTMLRVMSVDEAAAAEAAGIDIVSVPAEVVTHPDYRKVAPTLFSMTGLTHLEAGTKEDYLRFAQKMLSQGADALYCSASLETVAYLAREYIPIVGHVGLCPARATWTGGFVAVGKTSDSALEIYRQVKAYEEAGAIAVEIEVVPHEVAAEISKRTDLLLWSMGAGAGCDAQYLFACDVLGTNRGHFPRHSKMYRNLAKMEDRMQKERIAAFREFKADVDEGRFPEDRYILSMDRAEMAGFLKGLG